MEFNFTYFMVAFSLCVMVGGIIATGASVRWLRDETSGPDLYGDTTIAAIIATVGSALITALAFSTLMAIVP